MGFEWNKIESIYKRAITIPFIQLHFIFLDSRLDRIACLLRNFLMEMSDMKSHNKNNEIIINEWIIRCTSHRAYFSILMHNYCERVFIVHLEKLKNIFCFKVLKNFLCAHKHCPTGFWHFFNGMLFFALNILPPSVNNNLRPPQIYGTDFSVKEIHIGRHKKSWLWATVDMQTFTTRYVFFSSNISLLTMTFAWAYSLSVNSSMAGGIQINMFSLFLLYFLLLRLINLSWVIHYVTY